MMPRLASRLVDQIRPHTTPVVVHKRNERQPAPLVSIILLDWECRERFHTLRWLAEQNGRRDRYELLWVELHNRVVPQALAGADTLVTCGQKGLYHKHHGYNVGLLQARGQVVTVCDSDAVFPPTFVDSIVDSFGLENGDGGPGPSQVLMHHQWRTGSLYPDQLDDVSQMDQFRWRELWPNVGACMTVQRQDAIRFGGFDEHRSFRGYMCGPYDLGWRMVNAGIPERWHDVSVASWHFAHPDPWFSTGELFSWSRWREKAYPHIKGHALTAVEAFSTGRVMPLKEHPEIHRMRMEARSVGTRFEEEYATMTGPAGFSLLERLRLHGALWREPIDRIANVAAQRLPRPFKKAGAK